MRTLSLLLTLAAFPALAQIKVAAPGLGGVGIEPAFASFATEQLAHELRQAGVEVVTPRDMASVIDVARQKELIGCADTACAIELGNALGVQGVMLGDLAQIGNKVQVTVRVISVKDAKTLTSYSERVNDREALVDALGRAAVKMGRELGGKAGAAPPPPPPAAASAPDAGVCGGEWCQADFYERKSGESPVELNGLYAAGPDDVTVYGYVGTVARWDGQRWRNRHAPPKGMGILTAAFTAGKDVGFVGGQSGEAFVWKATGWSHAGLSNYAYFRNLAGLPDGGSVLAATDKGIYAWNGDAFVQQTDGGVRGVAVVAANDAWAVGDQGYIARWDGKAWKAQESPEKKRRLYSVSATGPQDVWVVGEDGVLLRWNGKAWKADRAGDRTLFQVQARSPSDVWTCGEFGALLHWDGAAWSAVEAPAATAVKRCMATGPNELWFVQNVEPQGTRAYRYRR